MFHYLAVVYGKLGLIADLAMAEKFILLDDTKQAYFFVKLALARKNELSSNVKLIKISDLLNTLRISENRK